MSVSESTARTSSKSDHRNIVQTVYLWRDPKDLIFEDDLEEVVPIAEGVVINKA
jgi:ferredoxin-NADP reductase